MLYTAHEVIQEYNEEANDLDFRSVSSHSEMFQPALGVTENQKRPKGWRSPEEKEETRHLKDKLFILKKSGDGTSLYKKTRKMKNKTIKSERTTTSLYQQSVEKGDFDLSTMIIEETRKKSLDDIFTSNSVVTNFYLRTQNLSKSKKVIEHLMSRESPFQYENNGFFNNTFRRTYLITLKQTMNNKRKLNQLLSNFQITTDEMNRCLQLEEKWNRFIVRVMDASKGNNYIDPKIFNSLAVMTKEEDIFYKLNSKFATRVALLSLKIALVIIDPFVSICKKMKNHPLSSREVAPIVFSMIKQDSYGWLLQSLKLITHNNIQSLQECLVNMNDVCRGILINDKVKHVTTQLLCGVISLFFDDKNVSPFPSMMLELFESFKSNCMRLFDAYKHVAQNSDELSSVDVGDRDGTIKKLDHLWKDTSKKFFAIITKLHHLEPLFAIYLSKILTTSEDINISIEKGSVSPSSFPFFYLYIYIYIYIYI
ncbi:MAG: hypothetical protein GY714_24755 [Desulfobacterales bacterium]|nr:hypothetical protein [Desulfobacterales bacterium]